MLGADRAPFKATHCRDSAAATSFQSIVLGLHRSDYLLHATAGAPVLQQVELNTIAASFASLSAKTGDLHRHVLASLGRQSRLSDLPRNASGTALADAIASAWKHYGKPR